MQSDKTFIMAAVNGARRTKADHPNLPVTPSEIAEECRRCRDAGAAAVHVHARDLDARHVLDPERFGEVLAAIKDETNGDLVIQVTTESVGRYSPHEMRALIRALEPEAASFAISELIPAAMDEGPARDFLHWCADKGIWTQYILYRPEEVTWLVNLHARGIIPQKDPLVLFVLGKYADGQRSTPADIDAYLKNLGNIRLPWGMCAFGAAEAACAARAVKLGGHPRVGFENNMLLPDGTVAKGTYELVRIAAEAARAAGRQVMTPAELRAAIGSSPRG